MTDAEHTITINRIIEASADDLYAAWTDPAIMRRWMAQTVDADVRVGSRYRNELTGDDGQTYIHNGEYLVLEPGRRIVQTFYVGNEKPGPEQKDILEITLRSLGPAQTELIFTDGWNGDELDEAGREANRQAWNSWLDELEKLS